MEVVRKGLTLRLFVAQLNSRHNGLQCCRCLRGLPPQRAPEEGQQTTAVVNPRLAKGAVGNAGNPKAEKINMAMKAYLERAQSHDAFMKAETEEFEIGKRHLANIMSLDIDTMTQDDIDKAIEYLLPSGLFEKKARPKMKPPTEVIPPRRAASFGLDGRPFHHMFYTGNPKFFDIMQGIVQKFEELKTIEDRMLALRRPVDKKKQLILAGSEWIKQHDFEEMLNETVSELDYKAAIKLLDRLAEHPYSFMEKDVIYMYRKEIKVLDSTHDIPPLQYDDNGVAFQTASARRKRANAVVTLRDKGTGKVDINGLNLLEYFPCVLDREQIMHPLQFTDRLMEMDLEAWVEGGGHSGQAGAIRHAMSLSLRSFVDRDLLMRMRLGGLLTPDIRNKERKKPGQKRARKKFTWKKR